MIAIRAKISYSAFYSAQFILLGVQLPFFSGWLALKGFSAPEIGLLTGLSLIVRLIIGPFVAFWADHQDDERIPLRLISAVFGLGAICLFLIPGKLPIAISTLMVFWSFGLLVPLTDSTVMRADRNGLLHYGQTRAIGSGAFLLTTLVVGVILTGRGLGAAVAMMALAGAATFFVSLSLPKGAGSHDGARPVSWREAPQLLSHPVFIIALVTAGLTQGAHAVYYAFSILHWTALNYSPAIIGALWASGVAAEIVLLSRARGMFARFSPALLLAIGAGATVLRWTVTAFDPSLWLLFPLQTLHALTFAATYLGAVEFLDRAAPTRLFNTAMTIVSTTGVGAITGIATVGAGYLFAGYGARAAYLTMALMGVGALGFAMVLMKKWDGKRLFD